MLKIKKIGLLFIIIGIILILLNLSPKINGAIINVSNTSLSLYLFISSISILAGIIFLILGDNLEDITERESQNTPPNLAPNTEYSDRQREYIDRNTPEYLRDYKPSWFYRLYRFFGKTKLKGVYGEYMNLIASVEEPVHSFVARNFGWDRFNWIIKKIGAIPINAGLGNLSDAQKQELLKRAPFYIRGFYKRELDKEKLDKEKKGNDNRFASNANAIKTMTSMLLQGRSGVILAEGPAREINSELEKCYAGYSLVAREYKRRTGKSLPIVPVGSYKGKVAFGKSFYIDENGKQTREELEELATKKIRSLYGSLS
jgi:hypothetical protein